VMREMEQVAAFKAVIGDDNILMSHDRWCA
jgi:hypothetical protein